MKDVELSWGKDLSLNIKMEIETILESDTSRCF